MSAQIKPEFQLIEAKKDNAYNLPVGAVYARVYIPAGASFGGVKIDKEILFDSWRKPNYHYKTRKFRVIEFYATPQAYQALMAVCNLSNLAVNRTRTKELAERLFKSQVAAVKATTSKSKTVATNPKKGTPAYNAKWMSLQSINKADEWNTKPATVEPFTGYAKSVDSPWVELDNQPNPVVVVGQEAVATTAVDSIEQTDFDNLVTEYTDLLFRLSLTSMRRLAKVYGVFGKGAKKAEYMASLARSLANATMKDKLTLQSVAATIRVSF